MTDSAEITDAENIIQKVNTLLDSSSPEDLEIAAKLLENIKWQPDPAHGHDGFYGVG